MRREVSSGSSLRRKSGQRTWSVRDSSVASLQERKKGKARWWVRLPLRETSMNGRRIPSSHSSSARREPLKSGQSTSSEKRSRAGSLEAIQRGKSRELDSVPERDARPSGKRKSQLDEPLAPVP